MSHESKALDSIDKILDLIWHEEGRLAIINRYGAYLSEEEKVQATQLITSQKANMDRLFTIYRDELLPLMHEVRRNSDAMNPLFDKLLTSAMMARQMNGEQNVTAENTVTDAIRNEEAAMQDGTALVNNADVDAAPAPTNGAVVETPVPTEAVVAETPVPTEAVVAETPAPTEAVVVETPAPTEASFIPTDAPVSEGTFIPTEGGEIETPVTGETSFISGGDTASGEGSLSETESSFNLDAAAANSASENPLGSSLDGSGSEESAIPFVLSPIDEGVAPAVSEEEVKEAEAKVEAADQQLGAIESVKTDIMASTELTEEEKTDKLEQYTRMTDGAVKAILVTKAQYEKLLVSRASQKALLKPAEAVSGDVVAATEETTSDVVATLPDFTAMATEETSTETAGGETVTEAKTEEAAISNDVVIPAIGGETAGSEGQTEPKAEEVSAGDGLVLPMIGGETPVSEAPVALSADQTSDSVVSDVVLEIPGAVSSDVPAETSSSNDLQTMIEQANALYKEGKTAEAQALFEKIGAMNKEAQAAPAEDAAVLVKK